jgi:hypothetical protein
MLDCWSPWRLFGEDTICTNFGLFGYSIQMLSVSEDWTLEAGLSGFFEEEVSEGTLLERSTRVESPGVESCRFSPSCADFQILSRRPNWTQYYG